MISLELLCLEPCLRVWENFAIIKAPTLAKTRYILFTTAVFLSKGTRIIDSLCIIFVSSNAYKGYCFAISLTLGSRQ
jgi:hypothetical protein